MSKKLGYYRFDIWYADLSKFGEVGNHYICIVSNFKNNTKSKYVNACIITSQTKKPHPAHVTIEINGKEATIKCEDIFTIEKKDLIRKIAHIEDIFLHLEINKALEGQMEIDGKYINYSADNMEEYFVESASINNDVSELEKVKCEIRNLHTEGKLELCVSKCDELIDKTLNSSISSKYKYMWYAIYCSGVVCYKLKQYNVSLSKARESLKYIGKISSDNSRYSYSMFLISSNMEKQGRIDESLRIYNSLNLFYKKIGRRVMRCSVLEHIFYLNNNVNRLKQLARTLKNINDEEYDTDKTKETVLRDIYKDIDELENKAI